MPKEPVSAETPLNPGWANSALPMVNVNWDDASAFCAWSGGRLPTEAEWEFAARAGSDNPRQEPWDAFDWYADNSGRERLDSTQYRGNFIQFYERVRTNANTMHEVRQKRPNAFNLYDMLGNVREWINDWYAKDYYRESSARDPLGPATGKERVMRGSSWFNPPHVGRTSSRYRQLPGDRDTSVGFRCGRDHAP